MRFIILLLLGLRISSVNATPASFLPKGFKSWFWPSSIVVGNWLYLHGGEIHHNDDGVMTYLPNSQTFAIDLSKSWSTSTVDAIISNHAEEFKPSRRPEIYHDTIHNVVYSYGGAYYSANFKDDHVTYEANVTPEVWGFTPPENGNVNWSRQFAKSISDSFPLTSSIEYALTTSSDKKHYSFGGTITYNVVPDGGEGVPIQMVMEDFVTYDYATQTYSNVSRTTPHSLAGEAQFVPQYGEEGVLLFFGGKNPVDRGAASLDLADLGSIDVYDIYTDTFYTQAATNAPTGRYSFCSVGASNANSSSYEIFIYGGDVGSSNSAAVATLSKVYILTLPAFHWLEVPTSASTWRNNHKCQKIGEKSISQHNQRQMLSVGGDQHPSGVDWSSYVDSWNSAMKIFDLTTLTWSDSYNPDAKAYTRPDMVNRFYSSNSAFPSTWGDAALNSIFNKSVTATTPKTTSTPTPTPTPTHTPEPEKETRSKTNVGDIAGGVVGGVFAVALAGFLLWWFCWRKPKAINRNSGALAATDYQGNQGYQNVKEGDGGSEGAEVELSAGKDMPRGELPADDTHQEELDAIEYQHKYRMPEPQKLSNGTR
ncbi:hypothetical protein VE01_03598 [Pseudogymnoascus verrucosus]|uniref:Kelch repeat protein n=1 Tax=Pseudogymnoascus verrucosus TaxID=342668 RepID=A0A1B8GS36_9PEZI|nr:uncharacterized protein VE01_03598 [Pseudogymnoascus verrucosus]OBT98643.1 hypothetical protein VE01_03598 [Pseudogymnoascus verrucosus]